jgi:hypothetical protein
MEYDEQALKSKISDAVHEAFAQEKVTTTSLVESLFVKLSIIVKEERRAYTISQLRELLTSLI